MADPQKWIIRYFSITLGLIRVQRFVPGNRDQVWDVTGFCLAMLLRSGRVFVCQGGAINCTWRRPLLSAARKTGASQFQETHHDRCILLHEQNRQLRALLQTVRWPPLTSCQVHGHTYELPCRLNAGQATLPTADRLRYLAGFFDGDGCVTRSNTSGSSLMLTVGQSFDAADVLFLFQSAFGGCIGTMNVGVGLRKPTLCWRVHGAAARKAARLLMQESLVKQKQLEVASEWPLERAEREHAFQQIRDFKQLDSSTEGSCSWEYFAGFFDADGYLRMKGKSSLELSVSQKYTTILESLRSFLEREMGLDLAIYHYDQIASRLQVSHTPTCKAILARLLDCGLVRKAGLATLALSLTPANAESVRISMAKHFGNQSFGKALDEAGVARAQNIHALNAKAKVARSRGQLHQAEQLLVELCHLKSEHALLNALLENRQLHEYRSQLLSLQAEAGE